MQTMNTAPEHADVYWCIQN